MLATDETVESEVAAFRQWALVALVGLSLAVAGACAFLVHVAPVFAVAAVVASLPLVGVGIASVVRKPSIGLIALLVLTVALFQPDDGLLPTEVVYLLLYLIVLGTWYGSRLISGEPMTRSGTDRIALFLSVAGVGGGVLLGLVHGAPFSGILGETIGFSTILLFLPVRDLVRTHRYGPQIVGAVLVWFGVWTSVRNMLVAYAAITGATQLWEIADVRAAYGDLPLHIGTVVAFGTAIALRGRALTLLSVALGTVCLIGVFLAKSRGFWVDLAFALVLLFALSPSKSRTRLVAGGVATVSFLFVPLVAVLGPVATVMLAGALNRFTTIGNSLTADVSLINRFFETEAVWNRIQTNPVVGHGFGTPFSYHSIIAEGIMTESFIHNGFIGVWYKMGLWGLLAVVSLWVASGIGGVWASRYAPRLSRVERGLALSAGVAVLSILPTITTSNPFLLFDTLIVLTITMGLAYGLFQRGASPEPDGSEDARP